MIVCMCVGVSTEEFTQALKKNHGNWHEASFETGAGTCCGGCRHYLAQLAMREEAKPFIEIPLIQTKINTSPE